MTDLERQALEILYTGTYVRVAGLSSAPYSLYDAATLPAPEAKAARTDLPQPIPLVIPPPSPVTTASFAELRRSRTRPVRYGPAEVRVLAILSAASLSCGVWSFSSLTPATSSLPLLTALPGVADGGPRNGLAPGPAGYHALFQV